MKSDRFGGIISNYPAKYNEPLPFSQRVAIAAHLLARIGAGAEIQRTLNYIKTYCI